MAFSAHKDEDTLLERYDNQQEFMRKVAQVGELVKKSKFTCFFTGAGISTDAGIPDFRGPNGVWTCKAKGIASPTGTSTLSAIPTQTHMSIVELLKTGNAHYLISQNCDGLHRRSGVPPNQISELHGNGNIEYCEDCGFQYLRDYSCYRITNSSDHYTGRHCVNTINNKTCNGRLLESTIDFGQNLPEIPLEKAFQASKKADLHIALGSSLTVSPACTMPKTTAKTNGKLVICNLQKTPLDHLCSVRIYQRCDVFMQALMNYLNLPIPDFKLNRRFKFIKYQDSSIEFSGIELGTNGQEIPATLMKCLEIWHDNTQQRITIQNLNQKPKFKVPENLERLLLKIHTMQHYAEPPITFEFDKNFIHQILHSNKVFEGFISFQYTPKTQTWIINDSSIPVRLFDFNDENSSSNQLNSKKYNLKKQFVRSSTNFTPNPRLWSCLTKVIDENGEGCVLLSGGACSSSNLSDLFIYRKNQWISFSISSFDQRYSGKLPFVNKPRWGHSACDVEKKFVFFFGGWDSDCQYNDIWLLDTQEHSFISLEATGEIPSPRACHSCSVIYDLQSLFIFGGSCCVNGKYEFYNDLYQFNTLNHSWKKIQTFGDIPSPRSQHSSILVDSKHLLIIGGYCGNKVLNDVYLLDFTTFYWKKLDTFGDIPPSFSVSETNFRVYPACFSSCLLLPNSQPHVLYSGETGTYLLDLTSLRWSKFDSLESFKGATAVFISDFSAISYGGIKNGDSTSDLSLYSIID